MSHNITVISCAIEDEVIVNDGVFSFKCKFVTDKGELPFRVTDGHAIVGYQYLHIFALLRSGDTQKLWHQFKILKFDDVSFVTHPLLDDKQPIDCDKGTFEAELKRITDAIERGF